ncbi:MAG: ABC transporter permease, partial [Thermoprotei archaeon]
MNNLTPYIIRRGIQTILTIFLIIILNFFIINLAPGDPIRVIAGEFAFSNPEYVEALRKRWGLDKPVSERLFIYLN